MITQSTPLRPRAAAPRAGKRLPLPTTKRPAPTHPISVGQAFLAMPFDAMRVQYGSAVMAGLTPRSLLASAKRERAIDALEKLILGPLARQR